MGGNGGAITNFTQPQALKASVDLVAGNGGDTINYGLISDRNTGVGRGESMTNINLANNAGVTDKDVAIRSYAADFAQQLRGGTVTAVTPETGNVGVVVGAAGRVRKDLPVLGGVTGSSKDFKAQNIMSTVAGSVDCMAAITSTTGLKLQNGGTEIGSPKNAYHDPNLNDGIVYTFDPANPAPRPFPSTYRASPNFSTGVYVFANNGQSGGVLIDGAVLARSYSGPPTSRWFPG